MTESARTARIAVSAATYWSDRPYSYLVPSALEETVRPGVRVLVPFGRGNRRTEGLVLSREEEPPRRGLKTVAAVLDAEPVLSPELLRLAVWIRERYFCTVYEAVRAMLPAGLWYSVEPAFSLAEGTDREAAYAAAGESEQEKLVLDAVFAHGGTCPLPDLERLFGDKSPSRALSALLKKGVLSADSREKRRVGDKRVSMAALSVSADEAAAYGEKRERRAPLQAAVLRLLCTLERVSLSELCYFTGAPRSAVTALEKAGYVTVTQEEVFRRPAVGRGEAEPLPTLNDGQQRAFEGLAALCGGETASAALLYGVTGSGKTTVYIRLIDRMLQ